MKLIGLSGTNGSGKDSTAEFLSSKYNYLFISVTDLLRDEAKKRGLPVERETLRTISAEWRREAGLGVLIEKAIEAYKLTEGYGTYQGLVVASLRNPGEADAIHEHGGTVVWVDADPHVRYKRVTSRKRSDEDNKTFEQFMEEERAEMSHSGDEATLGLIGVKEKADRQLINNGSTFEELEQAVQKQLGDVL